MFDLNNLLRNNIKNIVAYSSARDEFSGKEGIFLDANENPFDKSHERLNRYPDPYQRELKNKMALTKKVKADQIFLGNGSDEAIDLVIRAFCNPGIDNIIIMPPTYGMYEVSAKINDVKVKKVNLTQDFQINTNALMEAVDAHTKIIFICSPNNPTGNCLDTFTIKKIIEKFRGIVVLDEAYIDFAENKSLLNELNNHPNLVILRTFSKAWGLAGIRLGVAYASRSIIEVFNKIKPPYNINSLTLEKAIASVEKKKEDKIKEVEKILNEKERLLKQLSSIGFVQHIHKSDANFFLVKVNDAKELYQSLIRKGIITRNRSNVELCENCLRITVGTKDENNLLIKTLKELNI